MVGCAIFICLSPSTDAPADAGHLIHPFVGNEHIYLEPGRKQVCQRVFFQQINGNSAGSTLVVVGQGGSAHAVGNGQFSAGLYQACQYRNEVGRIWKMGKGVVDHDGIKLPIKACRFHVAQIT